MMLVNNLINSPDGFKDYFPLIHNYHALAANSTLAFGYDETSIFEVRKMLCREIMATQVAVVKVRLESNKYMRTVMDRRLSFVDKLAAFGKLNNHLNTLWGNIYFFYEQEELLVFSLGWVSWVWLRWCFGWQNYLLHFAGWSRLHHLQFGKANRALSQSHPKSSNFIYLK